MIISMYIIITILIIILVFMIIKLYFIRKSLKEIQNSISEILSTDTNNLLTISSSDKEIINLANSLNLELKNLREEKLQYENGNQELKTVMTNISHDMRTPLTAISGYIELIKENNDENKKKKFIEIIERKINDLILLTDQLFDFSKTMDMKINIKKEKCCINEIIEEALVNYYSIFKKNNIVPKIEICNKKIYKYVDKNTIIRVFENILSNVSKYSNGDFKVVLDEYGRITFSNRATSLDATTVQKIFNRYFTVENAKKSTGLGLSIAKQLIELNDGTISAKYIKNHLIIEIYFK